MSITFTHLPPAMGIDATRQDIAKWPKTESWWSCFMTFLINSLEFVVKRNFSILTITQFLYWQYLSIFVHNTPYVYICSYVCICQYQPISVHICAYVYICTYVCICLYKCISVHMYISVHMVVSVNIINCSQINPGSTHMCQYLHICVYLFI